MTKLFINLKGNSAEILNEFPIVFSTDRNVRFIINNYDTNKSYKLRLNKIDYDFKYNELDIDIALLKSIEKAYVVENTTRYTINVDKITPKSIINIQSGDKLNDLLLVLYEKIKKLESKFNELEEKINSGDLLL